VCIAGKERAILAKYIQFNQPHAMFWLGFDVDRAGAAIDWSDRNAPAPTLTITNPENGHAHLLYALKTSIRTAPDGKMKPLRYAAAVENALRKKLDADGVFGANLQESEPRSLENCRLAAGTLHAGLAGRLSRPERRERQRNRRRLWLRP
jgi:hypothetical protein